MSDWIIAAIVFRAEERMEEDDLKALITDIKMKTKNWVGSGEYEAVLNFCHFNQSRGNQPLGVKVPYDPAGMDRILLEIDELTSVKRFHALDVISGREHEKEWKTGLKAPTPKPVVDPENIKFGHDITKVNPSLRFMLTEAGPEIDAENFAAALEGYPFPDKSPAQNRDYIEMQIVAVLDVKFPALAQVNRVLEGKLVEELKVLANVDNQHRLPQHWHQAFGRAFIRGGNPPSSYASCCNFITRHLNMLDVLAAKGKGKVSQGGIASRYTELAIEADHIMAEAVAFD